MKKYLKIMSMLLMVAAMSFTVTSCGDDDSNESSKSSIVGTWSMDDDEGIVTFNADGTGTEYEWTYKNGEQVIKDYWPITYVFDETRNTLIVNGDGVSVCEVLSLTSNKLILRNKKDKIISFTKITELPRIDYGNLDSDDKQYSASDVVGRWKCEYKNAQQDCQTLVLKSSGEANYEWLYYDVAYGIGYDISCEGTYTVSGTTLTINYKDVEVTLDTPNYHTGSYKDYSTGKKATITYTIVYCSTSRLVLGEKNGKDITFTAY